MPELKPVVRVADDDAGFRKALCRLLELEGFSVEPFASAEALLQHPALGGPGCIVLDLQMPGLNGLDVQEQLAARKIRTPIIFLTGTGDIPTTVTAIKAGAIDFLTKPVSKDALVTAVTSAIARDRTRRVAEAAKREVSNRAASLTPREREVMRLVVLGRLNKQIAAELGICEATTKVHRGRVMQKMHVVSVADLVRATEEAGLDLTAASPQAPKPAGGPPRQATPNF